MTNSYNDGLEAAAKWHDGQAAHLMMCADENGQKRHIMYAEILRALKRPEPDTSERNDDEINRLTSERDAARRFCGKFILDGSKLLNDMLKALEPFALTADRLFGWEHDAHKIYGTPDETLITAGDLRHARSARAKGLQGVSLYPDPRDAIIKELMGALRPLADIQIEQRWDDQVTSGFEVTVGDVRRAREALSKAKGVMQATHLHLKTGGFYHVLCRGKSEADLSDVVIYQSMKDGAVWVRPAAEFDDGRFESIKTDSAKEQQGEGKS